MKKTSIVALFLAFSAGQLFAQQFDTIMLNLINPTFPSSFSFTEKGYWEETYNDKDYPWFISQVFTFSHLIEGEGSAYGGYAWNGFTVCNSGDNTNHAEGWNLNQWGCMAGGGIMTTPDGNILKDENGEVLVQKGIPYLVAYWNYIIEPEWWYLGYGTSFLEEPTRCLQILLDDNDEYEAVGVYLNIHPWAYYAHLYGNGLSRPLDKEGDFSKIIIHGINPDGTESGKFVEHYFAKFEEGTLTQSTKWEWIDLSSLGNIGGFFCTMETTDVNDHGPVSPVLFCMDKLQVRTQKVGIHTVEKTTIKVFPTVTNGLLTITNYDSDVTSAEIFTLQGKQLQTFPLTPIETVVNISSYYSGIYLLRVGNNVLKVVLR